MLSKSKTTKALLYSTAALSLFAASHVHADETSHWTARSVDQIKADISVNDNQQTINQYQRIFSKIQKGYHTQNLYSQQVNDTRVRLCTRIDKSYQ